MSPIDQEFVIKYHKVLKLESLEPRFKIEARSSIFYKTKSIDVESLEFLSVSFAEWIDLESLSGSPAK